MPFRATLFMSAYPNCPLLDSCVSRDIARESNSYRSSPGLFSAYRTPLIVHGDWIDLFVFVGVAVYGGRPLTILCAMKPAHFLHGPPLVLTPPPLSRGTASFPQIEWDPHHSNLLQRSFPSSTHCLQYLAFPLLICFLNLFPTLLLRSFHSFFHHPFDLEQTFIVLVHSFFTSSTRIL